MKPGCALVVTTISNPTQAMLDLAAGSQRHGVDFVVIGDRPTPKEFHLDGARFYSLEQQRELPFQLASAIPERHYSRKNLGYLAAIERGASCIIETDDDNLPREPFWHDRELMQHVPVVRQNGWVNAYTFFTDALLWPRGFPLERVRDSKLPWPQESETVACPIQQGLADGDPDVDAIYRLILPLPQTFRSARIALGAGAWCPFNSQNTTFFPDAFELLYLPSYCSFRMTDIWRSFIAQRIAWANSWMVLFHEPTVWQDRNEHNLLKDMSDECSGYFQNAKIAQCLDSLDLPGGLANTGHALKMCYEALVDLGVFDRRELELVAAWSADVSALRAARS